jgi:hypothetical protein
MRVSRHRHLERKNTTTHTTGASYLDTKRFASKKPNLLAHRPRTQNSAAVTNLSPIAGRSFAESLTFSFSKLNPFAGSELTMISG